MPFSIDQHPFSAASQSVATSYRIIDRDADHKIPVAMVIQADAATPQEVQMLADNIKDFMNGMPARHRFGKDKRTLHYTLLANGLSFAFHYHDENGYSMGISKQAAVLSFMPGQYEPFLKMMSDNLDKFTLGILSAGSEVERRAVPRKHNEQRTMRPTGPIVPPPTLQSS